MAGLIVSLALSSIVSSSPSPTSSSTISDSLSLPISTASAFLPSQTLKSLASSASTVSSLPSSSQSFSSLSASRSQILSTTTTLTARLVTGSTIPTTPGPTMSSFSFSDSGSSDQSLAIPVPWIVVIVVFSIAIIALVLGIYRARRRSINLEAALTSVPQDTPRPWSNTEITPGLIRRTTTSRLREDWQQWIARPPPLISDFRRSDSAVLFGTGSGTGSRLSCEALLTAHEVEVSGVLESTEILDPPPAYTPRRF